jgi:hypothetical protein
MFAQINHLVIQSPSSATVSYTVSNALPDSTSSSKILSYVGSGLRVLLCLYVLLVDLQIIGALLGDGSKNRWLGVKGLEFLDFPIRVVPGLLDWRLIVLLSAVTVFLCLRRGHTGKGLPNWREGLHPLTCAQRNHCSSSGVSAFRHLQARHTSFPLQLPPSYLLPRSRTSSSTRRS